MRIIQNVLPIQERLGMNVNGLWWWDASEVALVVPGPDSYFKDIHLEFNLNFPRIEI